MYMEHREGVTATAERSEEDGIGRDGPDFFTPISCDRSVFSGAKRTTDGLRSEDSELNPHRWFHHGMSRVFTNKFTEVTKKP